MPPAVAWFANIDNEQTRGAYRNDVQEFMAFAGLEDPHAFRQVGRGHILAWRRAPSAATIRFKWSALSSLFESLSEANACACHYLRGAAIKKPQLQY